MISNSQHFFILKTRVFIYNFTYIEEAVKWRGKKFTYPKCLKVGFPNLDQSRTIFSTRWCWEKSRWISIWKTDISNTWVNNYAALFIPKILTPRTFYITINNSKRLPMAYFFLIRLGILVLKFLFSYVKIIHVLFR